MEETPLVKGELISDQTCITDKEMIHELHLKGYGDIEKEKLFLKSFESLYLLYADKLTLKKGKRQINFDDLMSICQKNDSETLTKFLIYRDLKTRGYVVKDGFGFGSDFRVYERGQFGEKGAKFLIFGLNEGQQEKMGTLQKKIEQITQRPEGQAVGVLQHVANVLHGDEADLRPAGARVRTLNVQLEIALRIERTSASHVLLSVRHAVSVGIVPCP